MTLVPGTGVAYFDPGDGSPRIPIGEIESVEFEPSPLRPGDSVNVWPVSTPGGARGYIVARMSAYPDPMTATSPEPPEGDEPAVRTWVLDDGTETLFGPVERALRGDLGSLKQTARFGATLLASATALAQALDRAQPDKIAAIGREFREHVKRLEEIAGDDDSTSGHKSDLSTPV